MIDVVSLRLSIGGETAIWSIFFAPLNAFVGFVVAVVVMRKPNDTTLRCILQRDSTVITVATTGNSTTGTVTIPVPVLLV